MFCKLQDLFDTTRSTIWDSGGGQGPIHSKGPDSAVLTLGERVKPKRLKFWQNLQLVQVFEGIFLALFVST